MILYRLHCFILNRHINIDAWVGDSVGGPYILTNIVALITIRFFLSVFLDENIEKVSTYTAPHMPPQRRCELQTELASSLSRS